MIPYTALPASPSNLISAVPLQAIPLTKNKPAAKKPNAGRVSRGSQMPKPPPVGPKVETPKSSAQQFYDRVAQLDQICGEGSFDSGDVPHEFGQFAHEVLTYTAPKALRRDYKALPLEAIAAKTCRDIFLVGTAVAEMNTRAQEYEQVMQGKVPAEWIKSWGLEKTNLKKEHDQMLKGMQEEKQKLESDVASAQLAQKQAEQALKEKEEEVTRLLKGKDAEIAEAEKKAVQKFLGSRAFQLAALNSSFVEMRRVLYGVVEGVSLHYPFDSEEFRILPVPDEEQAPDLSQCTWKIEEDRLCWPDGSYVVPPVVCPDLGSFAGVKLKTPCPAELWEQEDGETEDAGPQS